jgi:hypothetical protein
MYPIRIAIFLEILVAGVGLATFPGTIATADGPLPILVVDEDTSSGGEAADNAASPISQEANAELPDVESTVVVLRPDTSAVPQQFDASLDNDETSNRDYLVETATPGDTMTRQGPALAIGRLHPEFVRRLAGAIREAREAGLGSAGVFSAYRPPAFGVGGFSNKFNSLHTYGLAVDMTGIGGPGSEQAKMWHEIAARHGVECPYGFANRVEWNHCQPTRIRIITTQNPLRETVTADGPIDLQTMFEAGAAYIENGTAGPLAPGMVDLAKSPYSDKINERANEHMAAVSKVHWTSELIKLDHLLKAESQILARSEPPTWCSHLHHPQKRVCGSLQEPSKKPRQALAASGRESRKL